jgi:hypothetical protein
MGQYLFFFNLPASAFPQLCFQASPSNYMIPTTMYQNLELDFTLAAFSVDQFFFIPLDLTLVCIQMSSKPTF